ncbi:hypothetical protein QN277_022801 [Acacia crassicarpa]|uniref:Uncharacterized protein n=1 Tax=Acacia crassicarpa TaxID=499986 RepID=A0AAE1JHL7_9FABA|nr:hypothetical protein QN277_022801 [Acacia crassicarpa]
MGDSAEARPDSEGCTSIGDWARHRKRRPEDIKKNNGISRTLDIFLCSGFVLLGWADPGGSPQQFLDLALFVSVVLISSTIRGSIRILGFH